MVPIIISYLPANLCMCINVFTRIIDQVRYIKIFLKLFEYSNQIYLYIHILVNAKYLIFINDVGDDSFYADSFNN